jgi:RNA polymerase sigma-70 factor (ECF subfamily)
MNQLATKAGAPISDEELLRLMMAGDADAFESLYERHYGSVYRFALRMTGSAALAEDITQDVFVELMRDGHLFDAARGTVAGYLFGMTRHRILRRLQRERSFISISNDEGDETGFTEQHFAMDHDPLIELSRQEMIDTVRQAVLALPAHYREVVVLCNLHEMSYDEAANVIGCPVGTVRSRLNRARAMLLEKLRTLQTDPSQTFHIASARYQI